MSEIQRTININESCYEKELSFQTFIEDGELHQATIIKKKIGTVKQLANKLLPEPPTFIKGLFSSKEFGSDSLHSPKGIDAIFTKDQHVFTTLIGLADLSITQRNGLSFVKISKENLEDEQVRSQIHTRIRMDGFDQDRKNILINYVRNSAELQHIYIPVITSTHAGGVEGWHDRMQLSPERFPLVSYDQIRAGLNEYALNDKQYILSFVANPTAATSNYFSGAYLYQLTDKDIIQEAFLPNVYRTGSVCMGTDFRATGATARTDSLLADLQKALGYFLASEFNYDLWESRSQVLELTFLERPNHGNLNSKQIFQLTNYTQSIPKELVPRNTAGDIPAVLSDALDIAKQNEVIYDSARRLV
jgi:hypothetical protein